MSEPTILPDTKTKEKRERWKRLAQHRTDEALRRIGMLEKLGRRAAYDYTPEQAAAVVETLESAVDRVREALEHRPAEAPRLQLPE